MIPLIERIAAGVNTEGVGGELFFCVPHVVLGRQKGRRVMVAPERARRGLWEGIESSKGEALGIKMED